MSQFLCIELSNDQQMEFFRSSGQLVRRVFVDRTDGRAIVIDKTCTQCLLGSDLPDVFITDRGICNHCIEFENQIESECNLARVHEIIQTFRGRGAPDSVVAFSGGKDSATVLIVAKQMLGLNPIALLVDNGYIPENVKDSAREFCNRNQVDLRIAQFDISRHAAQSLSETKPSLPCQRCIKTVFTKASALCTEIGSGLVITGHRFPPLTFRVSDFTKVPNRAACVSVAPLLALRISEDQQMELIRNAGWFDHKIEGNTTNCGLIGYAEEVFFDKFNFNPHIYEVSKEIRAGFYSRNAGLKKIARPVLEAEQRAEVENRLQSALREIK